MKQGMQLVVYPVKDIARARGRWARSVSSVPLRKEDSFDR